MPSRVGGITFEVTNHKALQAQNIVFAAQQNAETHDRVREIAANDLHPLCVLSPALNLSKNSCVFPCLDKAFAKTAIPKITRNGKKFPLATDSD